MYLLRTTKTIESKSALTYQDHKSNMSVARKLEKLWRKLTRQQEPHRFVRYQERFKKRYPKFSMGACTYGVPNVRHWDGMSKLTIGSYTSIAENVEIYLGGNHHTEWLTSYPFPFFFPESTKHQNYGIIRRDVVIGSDVWLCDDCKILPGITIGHGAVIATGAIITKNVEPYAVMAGNPAKLVRWRFDEPARNVLLVSSWWDWPLEEILKISDLLCSENIESFVAYIEQHK